MRLRQVVFAMLIALSFAPRSYGGEDIFTPKMPFKTLLVQYDITGSEKGSETLYIQKNGMKSAKIRKTVMKIFFQTKKTNTIELMTPDQMIQIDMDKRTAKKMTNPAKYMKEEYEKLSGKEKKIVRQNMKKMGGSSMGMLKTMGGEFKKKAGKHLGYTCDIFSFMGTKVYQMSETPVMLKMESHMLGMNSSQVATKVTKNGSLPSGVFTVPEGITPKYDKEADDMNRNMAKQMITMLKDPDAGNKMDRGIKQAEEDYREERREQKEEEVEDRRERRDGDRDRTRDREEEEEEEDKTNKVDDAIEKGKDLFKGLFN